MKIVKNKTEVVTEATTYHLHPNVVLREIIQNGKMTTRELNKVGKSMKSAFGDKLDFWPIYNPDLKYLEKSNPFWGYYKQEDEKFFKGKELPENPEDIDVSKIVFTSVYDHTFWTVDLEPIPVVVSGDYIEAGIRSRNYDLEKLHKYLSKHKQVKQISSIELIPYYNNVSGSETFFKVMVLPTKKQLKEMKNRKDIFYKPWEKHDFLGMKKFWIGKDEY